jgi:hypothetical protein
MPYMLPVSSPVNSEHSTQKDKRRKRIYTFPHQTLFSVLRAHRTSPTHAQTNSTTLLSVVVVVVRAHINCSVVVTLLIRGGKKKSELGDGIDGNRFER